MWVAATLAMLQVIFAVSLTGVILPWCSCRDYRESVLANLPHAWSTEQDTILVAAHFTKHRRLV